MKNNPDSFKLPIFFLPQVVLFPGMDLPLYIFEKKYQAMILESLNKDKLFGVVYAKGNLCAEVGTVAEIINVETLEQGRMNILTEGRSRFKIVDIISEEPYHIGLVEEYTDEDKKIPSKAGDIVKDIKKMSEEALTMLDEISNQELSKKIELPDDVDELIFLVAANLTCTQEVKQSLLEERSLNKRIMKIKSLLKDELKRLKVLMKNKESKNTVSKNGKLTI